MRIKISHQPTMKKVVSDRRASLDEETEIQPAMRALIRKEFDKGASIPRVFFPADGTAIQDSPRLTLVVADPNSDWSGSGRVREELANWMKRRGESPRLYPGSLVWALKKPGRDLREKVEIWLAWKRVATEITEGTLGGDFDPADRAEIKTKVADAEEAARDEVWGNYRYVVLADDDEPDGLAVVDLGAGHASSGESLCGRIITALKSSAVLNESVGAGYLEQHWPPALEESGAWPLASLRQSFLNGALTRLVDPDAVLRAKIVEFVAKGDFGLASGKDQAGGYGRLWFKEAIGAEEVVYESDVYLLLKGTAEQLMAPSAPQLEAEVVEPGPDPEPESEPDMSRAESVSATLRVHGEVPPESWNRLGTRLLPKLRAGRNLTVRIVCEVTVDEQARNALVDDLQPVLTDLGVSERVAVEVIE